MKLIVPPFFKTSECIVKVKQVYCNDSTIERKKIIARKIANTELNAKYFLSVFMLLSLLSYKEVKLK